MAEIKYPIMIMWSDEDDCFLGTCPQIKGMMVDGKTWEEVVTNLKIVIPMLLEVLKESNIEVPKAVTFQNMKIEVKDESEARDVSGRGSVEVGEGASQEGLLNERIVDEQIPQGREDPNPESQPQGL